MSGYRRRNNQGHESYLINQQLSMPGTYANGESNEFGYNGSTPYSFSQQSFSSYTPQFGSPFGQLNLPQNMSQLNPQYISPGQSIPQTSSQSHIFTQELQHQSQRYLSQAHYLHSPRYLPLHDTFHETEIESQESCNENTMLSEPVVPPLEGFPDVREFDQLMKSYVDDLSVKKQDKALIHAKRARNIKTVLIDPKDTAIESAQFRFWVKKMFKLQPVDSRVPDNKKMICHEGKPVAIREKLFKILTKAHQQCQHGGRDKTSAEVRRVYSWVPKELISRFVKICPTCQVRRGGARLTPPNSRRGSPRLESTSHSPMLLSPPVSRRESMFSRPVPVERSQADCFGQLHDHSGWADSNQRVHGRLSISTGSTRPLNTATMTHTNTMPAPFNSLTDEASGCSAQLSYSSGYITTTHGNSGHHDY